MTTPENPTSPETAAVEPSGSVVTNQVTTPAASTTGNQQEVDWQKRFAGLQGEYQRTKNQLTLLQAQLMEAQESSTRTTGEREALALEVGQLKTATSQAATDLTNAKIENERLGILISEFPALLPFYKDDLLPPGIGDEFRGKLKTFSDRLTNAQTTAAAQTLEQIKAGTPPPSPDARTDTAKPDALLQEAFTALRAGKPDEYDRLYTEYLIQSKGSNTK